MRTSNLLQAIAILGGITGATLMATTSLFLYAFVTFHGHCREMDDLGLEHFVVQGIRKR